MDIIQALQDKNNQNAYQLLLELETKSSETNELYPYFENLSSIKILSSGCADFVCAVRRRHGMSMIKWEDICTSCLPC